jgi:hypothetical protein
VNLFGRSFVGYLWVWAEDILFGETGRTFLEAWELFWSSLRSLKTFGCHCVLLCTTLLRRRVAELSNLCGLAQVRAVKKNRCDPSCVFTKMCQSNCQDLPKCTKICLSLMSRLSVEMNQKPLHVHSHDPSAGSTPCDHSFFRPPQNSFKLTMQVVFATCSTLS